MSEPSLLDRVRARLAVVDEVPSRAGVAALVRAEAGGLLGDRDVLLAARDAVDELAGAGPLEPLLRLPGVTDVLVNGPGEVWLDRGAGLERAAGVRFPDDDAVRRLAVRLAASAGRRLDDAAPWVDVGLPGGTRLHAVLPPVSAGGTCLSLRVLRRCAQALADLAAGGALPGESGALVRAVVARRVAFLVTGGTGSGKTTLLSALLGEVDPAERLVLCEDAAELTPPHPHVVRLLTRPPNVEGAGAVGLRDLVRQALRMRPDRLVVGEVRGPEVVDLLAALNTGHDGGCGTLHANRAAEVPARLEALGVAAGLGRAAVHSQTAAALDVVLHLRRTAGGRQLSEIGLLRRQGELVVVEPGWRADGGPCPAGDALRRLLAGP
ncbi:TadA family conjugal transfer-associated ATPase [Blastococcus sp. MG754426]|uniref:TadA family conjugal transfer-associated ATPase n=1 Tax=unclassified Blastococcus TaxID=2619396 RepID=UPI001EEFA283|nr:MULTISPECIES: TadA family conjugal transfer-associated ATPase [unclassified Blastococcus]MCF6506247.1 TadA family conjugal transfer-associated ATPase [Blastococcus sp. MG754426]MCF6510375.1 TadA family conjugal transfer-associated ATPase [Blastococcus sp. MG754427]MCF6737580.1 TadA family conjugal transfer-associated ATPase [Blastococcus sp. KM273129]